jgi:hypothetical protein
MASDAWRNIFAQSPVNRGCYDEAELPHCTWNWPKGIWFQARRNILRERHPYGLITCEDCGNPRALQSLNS